MIRRKADTTDPGAGSTRHAWHVSAFLFLLLTLCLGQCSSPADGEWAEVLVRIESEFPDVPQMPVEELSRLLARKEGERPLVIDARGSDEFAVSHLPGAIPASSVIEVQTLPGYRPDRLVVVYCSVGYRSSTLANQLLQNGHRNVSNLRGSIFRWANQGLPLEREGKEVREVHPYSESWGRLLKRDLWAWEPGE